MDADLRVFAVDDDPAVLKALERMLRSHNIALEGFTSSEAFLERPPYEGVACLLLDLQMPGLSGLDVQHVLRGRALSMPIVFLSAQSDVRAAARAMRDGALDFLVKPVEEEQLLDAIERARAQSASAHQQQRLERDAEARLARLTRREIEVCELVAAGLLNKQIAHELGMSEKTVKVHRGRATRKLDVDSVAALVRLLSNLPKKRSRVSTSNSQLPTPK